MTAPIVFGRLHVLPVVTDFLKAFPDINARLVMSDRPVSLADEHIDVALRISFLSENNLIATRLGAVRRTAYASPDYLRRRGTPLHPRQLIDHSCISFEGVTPAHSWIFRENSKDVSTPIQPRLAVNTAEAAVDAAVSGLGITQTLSYQAKRAVGEGQLVALLEDFERPPSPVHIVYLSQGVLPLKLRTFLDFAVPRLRSVLC